MTRRLLLNSALAPTVALLSCIRVALALPSGLVPRSTPITDPSLLCRAAIHMAEADNRTPPGLLDAIATVESGRRDTMTGKLAPWPWTIDANGDGHTYPTEAAAVAAAQRFQQQGIHSLDIGCMQVNLQQHPAAFASLAQAFSPTANALFAAGFLVRLKHRLGGWTQAIAAYHSQTPSLGTPYARKVLARWKGPGHAAMPLLPVASHPGWVAMVPGVKPKTAKPVSDSKTKHRPGATQLRRFGLGGFAFASLHGSAGLLPAATSVGDSPARVGVPGSGRRSVPPGRGLAAYRRRPIPIAGAS